MHDANPSLLGGLVVETQHIHEDEEDISEEENGDIYEPLDGMIPINIKSTT